MIKTDKEIAEKARERARKQNEAAKTTGTVLLADFQKAQKNAYRRKG